MAWYCREGAYWWSYHCPLKEAVPPVQRRSEMKLVLSLLITLAVWAPTFVFAEEHGGGYRGIAQIYYTFIWAILTYGLYDVFGKKAMYVGSPILAIGIYLLLPPV